MDLSRPSRAQFYNKPILNLYGANSANDLSAAIFSYLESSVANKVTLLLFRPLESQLPCRSSRAEMMPIFKRYVEYDHRHDLWLRRSPVHPGVRVVRHSDYTSVSLLKKSAFYRRTLSKLGVVYGASVVAWKKDTWLATATLLRSQEQGDFTNEEIKKLLDFQEHFANCFQKVAKLQEEYLALSSLEKVIARLPTGILVLDWNGQVIHVNAEGTIQLERWRNCEDRAYKQKLLSIPSDILEAVKTFKRKLILKRNIDVNDKYRNYHYHSIDTSRYVVIDFMPARTLTMSRGTFLVHFCQDSEKADQQFIDRLSLLSKAERKCYGHLREGCTNKQIAAKLGISAVTVRNHLSRIFRKLGVHTRAEAIAVITKNFSYK